MELIKVVKNQSNYHQFFFDCKSTDKLNLFISSDWHFDNPKCNRTLLVKHLDDALKRDAKIIITGDLLCLMQGAYDPRRNKSAIRVEHNGDNYLDLVINDTANFLLKYAKNILIITAGNHETSVSKRNETDVLIRLIERVNALAGTNIQTGEYMGYFRLSFSYLEGRGKSLTFGYDHGHWGGIITKGVLSVVRMAAIMPDSDIVISGHTHDGWIVPHAQLKMNDNTKKVSVKNQWHIKTGTYKEEFESGRGWAVERIGAPKYLGGCFAEINYNQHQELDYTFTLTH
jgi:predicted phosphodiesterase